MSEKTINIINSILYYVIAPLLVLEFILADLKIIPFTKAVFIASMVVLVIFCVISYLYKRVHPDYEFKANEMYMRVLVAIIVLECFYTAGFFEW